MEMSIPHRIGAQIPQEGDIQAMKGGYRTHLAEAVRREESGNHRRRVPTTTTCW
ncbi:hypothetical protein CLOSTMETH_00511 [[Clostridium] methylpentosum DSM 5476]|uniref:Uncharacterized protein n=1 Tax=[Clostridium] methylpentosum DSM 5476 TaxID=537013 RepID=C0E9L2_9FIRM|nr:hypothetical protein CLOSTMETH_00511 [[Clostridium] methylpentosum DSM 5476]